VLGRTFWSRRFHQQQQGAGGVGKSSAKSADRQSNARRCLSVDQLISQQLRQGSGAQLCPGMMATAGSNTGDVQAHHLISVDGIAGYLIADLFSKVDSDSVLNLVRFSRLCNQQVLQSSFVHPGLQRTRREAGNSSTYAGMLALRYAQFQHAVRLPASIAAPATLCCIAHISCLIWRLLRCPEGKLSTDCPVIEGLSQVCPIGVFRGIRKLLQLAEGGHC
jgi:hypothetical protein